MRLARPLPTLTMAITLVAGLLIGAPPVHAAEGGGSNYAPGLYGDFGVAVAPEPGFYLRQDLYSYSGDGGGARFTEFGEIRADLEVDLPLEVDANRRSRCRIRGGARSAPPGPGMEGARGGSADPMELYLRFRGKQPEIAPLLAVLKALKADPENTAHRSRLAEEFDALGPGQGAVLTYAPYIGILLTTGTSRH